MGASLFVNVLDEVLLAATALVGNGLLAASREELDGGVRGNTKLLSGSLALGGLGVDLGNNNVLLVDEVGGEGLPDRGESLAVCTKQMLAAC